MLYATQADLEARFGADAVALAADRDGSGAVDAEAVATALADATAEIDSALGGRYPVPLAAPLPPRLVRCACTLAIYHLASGPTVATERRRLDYQDERAWLKQVQQGQAVVPGLDMPSAEGAHAGQILDEVLVDPLPRLFGRRAGY